MKIDEIGIEVFVIKNKEMHTFEIYDRELFQKNFVNIFKKVLYEDYKTIKETNLQYTEEDIDKIILDGILKIYDSDEKITISQKELDMLLKTTRASRIKKMNLL